MQTETPAALLPNESILKLMVTRCSVPWCDYLRVICVFILVTITFEDLSRKGLGP